MSSSRPTKAPNGRKPRTNYWSATPADVFRAIGTGPSGLPEVEAARRLQLHGFNELPQQRPGWPRIFARQFRDPLSIILLVAAAMSGFVGDVNTAITIIVIVVLSAVFGFFNEYRAEKLVEDLKRSMSVRSLVIREGRSHEIDARQLVFGDLVSFYVGDIVTADVRVTDSKDLEADEAILTGESFPVEKSATPVVTTNPSPTQLSNYLFTGTVVARGSCHGVVIATGRDTEYGAISRSILHPRPENEFQRGVRSYGKMLITLALALTIAIFALNAAVGHPLLNSLLFGLAIAVGLVPELMPAIVTISLARGAKRMARSRVVVKRLVAIEDFGNMNVLCTDKTGTLTEGKIALHAVDSIDKTEANRNRLLGYSLLCNAATVGDKVVGNPMDRAIWEYAIANSLRGAAAGYEKIDEVPFDYQRRLMSAAVRRETTTLFLTKGAPEAVMAACTAIDSPSGPIPLLEEAAAGLRSRMDSYAKDGYRVIGVAFKKSEAKPSYSAADENALTFAGFLVFTDPIKSEAGAAVAKLKQLEVDVKILTGDSDLVAVKLCKELKVPVRRVVCGPELPNMTADEFRNAVEEATIFARITPEQKLDVIKALKAGGHIVGFMGDGVNDAPALYEADVGISVDSATDVAKDAADVVLLEKDLDVLADGIGEGRRTFGNTIKYVLMGTSSNFGNMFSAAASSVFLPFLPMLPMQILFMNLLYNFSNFTLPGDNVDEEASKWPHRWDIGFVRKFTIFFGPFSSLYDFLTFGIMLYVFNASAPLFQSGWFVESFWTEVLIIFVIRTRRIPFFSSRPSKWLTILTTSCVAIGTIIPFTLLGQWLGFVALPSSYWLLLVLIVATYLLLVDVGKVFFYRICEL